MDVSRLNIELSDVQKRALFKLAVDLVKADKQIHRDEVSLLDKLQSACNIDATDIEFIHYISLQQAISCLHTLADEDKREVIAVLESVIGADNDIDKRESLLLSAIKLCLDNQSSGWSMVVSTSDIEAECSSEQIVYLERDQCQGVSQVLNDKYDYLLLTKALDDVGLHLFYLPKVVGDLERHWSLIDSQGEQLQFLRRSMEFIVPVGDGKRLADLNNTLKEVDTKRFYKVICSRYNIRPDVIPYSGFLMVKVADNYLLEDDGKLVKTVDFLCIDISESVKQRILHFVGLLEQTVNRISYEGYYRMLYDYLSSEAKIMSTVVIDRKGDFRLVDLDNIVLKFESAPQAKSFYLLLLRYGKAGVTQECFDKALDFLDNIEFDAQKQNQEFDIENFKHSLLTLGSDWAKVVYNLIVIYEHFSTKDSGKRSFLSYISKIIRHRSSIKNYINGGFTAIYHLASPEHYCVQFDKHNKSYFVDISPSMLQIEGVNGVVIPFTEHTLWTKLVK